MTDIEKQEKTFVFAVSFKDSSCVFGNDQITVGFVLFNQKLGIVKKYLSEERMNTLKSLMRKKDRVHHDKKEVKFNVYRLFNFGIKSIFEKADDNYLMDYDKIYHSSVTQNGIMRISRPTIIDFKDEEEINRCFENFIQRFNKSCI